MTYGPTGITGGSGSRIDESKKDEAALKFAGLAAKKTATDWQEPARKNGASGSPAGEFQRQTPRTPANSNTPQMSAPPGESWTDYAKSAFWNAAKSAAIRSPLLIVPAALGMPTIGLIGGYAGYNSTGRNPCGTMVTPCASAAMGLQTQPELSLSGENGSVPGPETSLTYGMPKAAGGEEKQAGQPQLPRVTVLPDDLQHEAIAPDGHDKNGQVYWNLTTVENARKERAERTRPQANAINQSEPATAGAPLTSEQIEYLSQLDVHGVRAQRILPGENGQVAIIGRSMGDFARRGEYGVVDYARTLRSEGYKTELFAGPMIKKEWFDEVDVLRQKYGESILPEDVIKETEIYRQNKNWAQKLIDEHYTIIDVGDPNGKPDYSPFYGIEASTTFNESTMSRVIDLGHQNGYGN